MAEDAEDVGQQHHELGDELHGPAAPELEPRVRPEVVSIVGAEQQDRSLGKRLNARPKALIRPRF